MLCLGGISDELVEAWESRIKGFLETRHLKNLDRIDGEPMEFEWKNFPGFTTLKILHEVQKMMTESKCEPEQFKGRIIFMSVYKTLYGSVEAHNGVELLLPTAPLCPEVVCIVFFFSITNVVCCFFFASSSPVVIDCVCRNQTTLQIGTTERIHCAASDMLVVTLQASFLSSLLGLPWSQWCSDGCALGLFCSSGFWLRLFVARFCLADVGRGVRCRSIWSVSAFCRVGSGDTVWPVGTLERRQVVSSQHSAAGGRRVTRASLVFWRSGASDMGANAR